MINMYRRRRTPPTLLQVGGVLFFPVPGGIVLILLGLVLWLSFALIDARHKITAYQGNASKIFLKALAGKPGARPCRPIDDAWAEIYSQEAEHGQ